MSRCTRCGECVTACPHRAIFLFNDDQGELSRTPVMMPDERPCHLCAELFCVASCASLALVPPTGPLEDGGDSAAAGRLSLGTVVINESDCLAFKGPECGACVGLCPREASAISAVRWRPQLDASACLGCGLCIEACPTEPKAIVLRPVVDVTP